MTDNTSVYVILFTMAYFVFAFGANEVAEAQVFPHFLALDS
jgi:hypothetical protein